MARWLASPAPASPAPASSKRLATTRPAGRVRCCRPPAAFWRWRWNRVALHRLLVAESVFPELAEMVRHSGAADALRGFRRPGGGGDDGRVVRATNTAFAAEQFLHDAQRRALGSPRHSTRLAWRTRARGAAGRSAPDAETVRRRTPDPVAPTARPSSPPPPGRRSAPCRRRRRSAAPSRRARESARFRRREAGAAPERPVPAPPPERGGRSATTHPPARPRRSPGVWMRRARARRARAKPASAP